MYSKFLNKKTQLPFVIATKASEHYKQNKDVSYLGRCDESGNITIPAEQDEEYQRRTLQDHLNSVEANLKKKTVRIAEPNLGSDESELTTDIDDEA